MSETSNANNKVGKTTAKTLYRRSRQEGESYRSWLRIAARCIDAEAARMATLAMERKCMKP